MQKADLCTYFKTSRRTLSTVQLCLGILCFTLGLTADCAFGVMLLNGKSFWFFLLHFPMVLLWVFGMTCIHQRARKRLTLDKWNITALCLSWTIFPGLGPLTYSLALSMIIFAPARARHAATSLTTTSTLPQIAAIKQPQTKPRQLLEMVYSADLAVRRATIATLGKQPDHRTAHLFRQLLVDPQPEIRGDAAILLKRMEEQYAQDLQTALEAWQAQPTKERALVLIEQYYQYASSNILDDAIQHFYYQRAYDLLLPIIQKHRKEACLWMRLAYLHSHFGDFLVGLHAAYQAWKLQPTSTEAYQLALDLAFRAHAWDKLSELTTKGQSMISHVSKIREAAA